MPTIKGFTTFGNRVIDLTPTREVRTSGNIRVVEPTKVVARIREHKNNGAMQYTLDRLHRPAKCSTHRLKEAADPLRVRSYEELLSWR